MFSIDKPDARGRRWQWDGNAGAPTFFPDMDVWPSRPTSPLNYFSASRCRYTLIAGVIEFFGDCTHRLAGRRVPLPDLPGHLRE